MTVINITAVVAVAIFQMALGALWYGPLFGKYWMKLVGLSAGQLSEAQKKGMKKTYAWAFAGSLISAYMLAILVAIIDPDTFGGMQIGFIVWLGFVFTTLLSQKLWLNKPKDLLLIDSIYYLTSLLISGLILAYWR